MTNLQLFIAISVPMLFNGAMLLAFNSNLNRRFNSLDAHFNRMEARLDVVIGKIGN